MLERAEIEQYGAKEHRVRRIHFGITGRRWPLVLFAGVLGVMMATSQVLAIDVVGSTSTTGTGVSGISLTQPATTVAGDVLIAHISVNGGTTVVITPPAGWSGVQSNTTGSA